MIRFVCRLNQGVTILVLEPNHGQLTWKRVHVYVCVAYFPLGDLHPVSAGTLVFSFLLLFFLFRFIVVFYCVLMFHGCPSFAVGRSIPQAVVSSQRGSV